MKARPYQVILAIVLCLSVLAAPLQHVSAQKLATVAQTPVNNRADYKGDICYQIITDRFFDGDTNNNNPSQSAGLYDSAKNNWKLYWGGDWAGIQQKMNYLRDMGVTAIWISPPVDNINVAATYGGVANAGYHGYWARDFYVPEEHFGSANSVSDSWQVFNNMVSAAHTAGIKVIIDWAPNHTSPADSSNSSFAENGALYENGTFRASLANDPNGYFHHNGGITNWDDRYQTQYLNLADLADFEQTNSYVNSYLENSLNNWLNTGVDGVRVDAIKHMTYGWQRAYASRLMSPRGQFWFGEWYLGGYSDPLYADNVRYTNESGISALDFYMNKAIRDAFGYGQSMQTLDAAIVKTGSDYKYKENLVTFIDNHDMSRFLTINNNNSQLHLALTFLLTVRGTPCIFYGTEQYLHNDSGGGGDPYNRPMMSQWDQTTTAYQLINRLSTLKQNQPALQYGSHQQRWINSDVYIYERSFYNDTVLVAMNKSATQTYNVSGLYTKLPAGTYSDQLNGLLGGFNITVTNGGGNNPVNAFNLGPGKAIVWSYKAGEPGTPQIGSVGPTLVGAGTPVTIDGRGFGTQNANTKAYIGVNGGWTQMSVSSWSANQVVATVPSGLAAGAAQIKVVNSSNQVSNLYDVMLTKQLIYVTFNVNNASTNWGEQVYLTGNAYELSNWSTATWPGSNQPITGGALGPAVTTTGMYPTWKLTAAVPCGTNLEFKFVKINSTGGVTWEAGGNHTYTTPSCSSGPGDYNAWVNWQY